MPSRPQLLLPPRLLAYRLFGLFCIIGFAAILSPSCSSSGGSSSNDDEDDGGGAPIEDGVSVLIPGGFLRALSGEDDFEAVVLLATSDGRILIFDAISGSVFLIGADSSASVLTRQKALTDLTGGAQVTLGAMDQLLDGPQADEIVAADQDSGQILRINTAGTPTIHATTAEVSQFTGVPNPIMSLPRYLTSGQLVAQELISGDILLFGTSGTLILEFVDRLSLAVQAGVTPADAVVTGWARGGGSGTLFGRFGTTNNIIRVAVNGTVARHVDGVRLANLFPNLQAPRVLDFVADTITDALLILVADGTRGLALAVVDGPSSGAAIFATPEQFLEAAGNAVDISAIGILSDGTPYAIDRGGIQILTFGSAGEPLLVARRESIEREAGTDNPSISQAVRLGSQAVIVPESVSDNLLRID